jgi:hypothetical protein
VIDVSYHHMPHTSAWTTPADMGSLIDVGSAEMEVIPI